MKLWDKTPNGLKVMHLYGDGSDFGRISLGMAHMSRLLHMSYDKERWTEPHRYLDRAVLYFEFDQWDSRYSAVSCMLWHFIQILICRFWTPDVKMLSDSLITSRIQNATTRDELYHLFKLLRVNFKSTERVVFFIACFDQCLIQERDWFIKQITDEPLLAIQIGLLIHVNADEAGIAKHAFILMEDS